MHVDDFIWNGVGEEHGGTDYARWMLMFFRLPALQHALWKPFMEKHKLFCTWKGKRYRVTGASRMGDVWLAEDQKRDTGYDHRVDVVECSEWRAD